VTEHWQKNEMNERKEALLSVDFETCVMRMRVREVSYLKLSQSDRESWMSVTTSGDENENRMTRIELQTAMAERVMQNMKESGET